MRIYLMHCKACDKLMNEWELKKIDPFTNDYADLCSSCLSSSYRVFFDDITEEDSTINDNEPLTIVDDSGTIVL